MNAFLLALGAVAVGVLIRPPAPLSPEDRVESENFASQYNVRPRIAASDADLDEALAEGLSKLPIAGPGTPGHKKVLNPWKVLNVGGQVAAAILSVIPVTAPAGMAASAVHGAIAKKLPPHLYVDARKPSKLAWNPVNALGYIVGHPSNEKILRK